MRSSVLDIRFSDFAMSFKPHPNTGDITRLTNEDSIKRSIRNLILTGYNERLFSPGKGCGIYSLLFEQMSTLTANSIEQQIRAVLRNWESRITVTDVAVIPNFDENGYDITVQYEIINEVFVQSIDFFLELIR